MCKKFKMVPPLQLLPWQRNSSNQLDVLFGRSLNTLRTTTSSEGGMYMYKQLTGVQMSWLLGLTIHFCMTLAENMCYTCSLIAWSTPRTFAQWLVWLKQILCCHSNISLAQQCWQTCSEICHKPSFQRGWSTGEHKMRCNAQSACFHNACLADGGLSMTLKRGAFNVLAANWAIPWRNFSLTRLPRSPTKTSSQWPD